MLLVNDEAKTQPRSGDEVGEGLSGSDHEGEWEPPTTQETDWDGNLSRMQLDVCFVVGFQIWALSSGGVIEHVLKSTFLGRALLSMGLLSARLAAFRSVCPVDGLPWPNAHDTMDDDVNVGLDANELDHAAVGERCARMAAATRSLCSAHPASARELINLLHDTMFGARASLDAAGPRRDYDRLHERVRAASIQSYHGQTVQEVFRSNVLNPAWSRMDLTRSHMSADQLETVNAVFRMWEGIAREKMRKGRKEQPHYALGFVTPGRSVAGVEASFFMNRGGKKFGILNNYEARAVCVCV